jgi:hypothetical protein
LAVAASSRVLREDVEDQLAPIDHLSLGDLLNVADLARREVVVENDRLGIGRVADALKLIDLALAHEHGGFRAVPALFKLGNNQRPRLLRQGAEFAEGIRRVVVGVWEPNRRKNRAFRLDLDCGAFFVRRHG